MSYPLHAHVWRGIDKEEQLLDPSSCQIGVVGVINVIKRAMLYVSYETVTCEILAEHLHTRVNRAFLDALRSIICQFVQLLHPATHDDLLEQHGILLHIIIETL